MHIAHFSSVRVKSYQAVLKGFVPGRVKGRLTRQCTDMFRWIGRFQPSATSPLFLDNLHFGQIAKSVNNQSRLTLLAICPKWRLSKKRGLVAGWSMCDIRFYSPRNPRFPIVHFDIQTAFRARVSIFKSGISGSGFVSLGQKKSQDAYRTSHPIPFGWSMCDIRCLYFLARKNHKMHIAHFSSVSVKGRRTRPC